MKEIESVDIPFAAVNRAFTKQSMAYDLDDNQNPILQQMRQQVYHHVSRYLKEKSKLLELNSGTGIDALHFVQQGHTVLATDLSDGMISEIQKKINDSQPTNKFTCQQLSYDQLDRVIGNNFDYVFSNFGGLNCIADLSLVTKHLPKIVKPGGYVTWVIMPPIYLWELLWVFKGNVKQAFRRLNAKGTIAHLEGEYFKTYYHSLSQVKAAFGADFKFVRSEGLCSLLPPPSSSHFSSRHPNIYSLLQKVDSLVRSNYPFNRWADHLIITFQKQ